MLVWSGQLPDAQETSMGWAEVGLGGNLFIYLFIIIFTVGLQC